MQVLFLPLRQLRLSRNRLTTDAAKTLIHAFVSSRLDYCNSLLVGVADCVIRKLQGVQSAAARISPKPINSTTSHRSFENCIGFRSPSGYNTRSRCWSTKCLQGLWHPRISLRTDGRSFILYRTSTGKLDVQRSGHSHWSQELCCFRS